MGGSAPAAPSWPAPWRGGPLGKDVPDPDRFARSTYDAIGCVHNLVVRSCWAEVQVDPSRKPVEEPGELGRDDHIRSLPCWHYRSPGSTGRGPKTMGAPLFVAVTNAARNGLDEYSDGTRHTVFIPPLGSVVATDSCPLTVAILGSFHSIAGSGTASSRMARMPLGPTPPAPLAAMVRVSEAFLPVYISGARRADRPSVFSDEKTYWRHVA